MDKFLIYVNYIGSTTDNINTYEFIFNYDSTLQNEEWNYDINCSKNSYNLIPTKFEAKIIIKTKIELTLIQDSCCFGMSHCQDGIIALAYENIDNYEEYPEYRLVLPYGISYEETLERLAKRNILIEKNT